MVWFGLQGHFSQGDRGGMKLRCVRIIDERTGRQVVDEKTGGPLMRNSWLSVGNTYHALSLVFDARQVVLVRLVADDGLTPGLCRLEQFDVISPKIPSNWVVGHWGGSCLELSPQAWLGTDYWDRYFDGDRDARLVFEKELRRILSEDP